MVMTTEVLRNMLYTNSTTLLNLGFVVMDEVHYLADNVGDSRNVLLRDNRTMLSERLSFCPPTLLVSVLLS